MGCERVADGIVEKVAVNGVDPGSRLEIWLIEGDAVEDELTALVMFAAPGTTGADELNERSGCVVMAGSRPCTANTLSNWDSSAFLLQAEGRLTTVEESIFRSVDSRPGVCDDVRGPSCAGCTRSVEGSGGRSASQMVILGLTVLCCLL